MILTSLFTLLIAEQMAVNGPALLTAIQATFGAYGLDEPPLSLPAPPSTWKVTFKKLAEEVGLSHTTLPAANEASRRFLEPVLRGAANGVWSPIDQAWK